jgi:hypothetical protein
VVEIPSSARQSTHLVYDYKNNIQDISINILKAFRQLEAAEVDPSLLAYSIILSKDPSDYRTYTPQHKIGKSLKKEAGDVIKYYKTGQQEDGYKGLFFKLSGFEYRYLQTRTLECCKRNIEIAGLRYSEYRETDFSI